MKQTSENKTTSRSTTFIFLILILTRADGTRPYDFSITAGAALPMMGLNEWYSPTAQLGIQAVFTRDESHQIVVEVHTLRFNHGTIEDREFRWLVDYQLYKSPQAAAQMIWNDFIVKNRVLLPGRTVSFGEKRWTPFWSFGAGFYNYVHRVSGLVYPGQPRTPLDTKFVMDPVSDRRVAWGGNLGAGVNVPLAGRFEALLTADYHMTIGYLRSFEEWGLNEVVPIQFLSINIGVTF